MASKPKIYEQIGGRETCQRISDRFHERVESDPVLRVHFPKNLAPATERLALFLVENLGGPADYTRQRGKTSLICRHAHLPIGSQESEAWLSHMFAVMDDLGLSEAVQDQLRGYFTETAATVSDPFLPYYHLPLPELKAILESCQAMASSCESGRTLLGRAAREWDLPKVQMLLDYGASVHTRDGADHNALYHAAGALVPGRDADGRAVVELLLKHGANPNGRSGVGQMTPLHMAARRDNVAIGEALLLAGAEIEARDTKGETPLRRAVNCNQDGMVRLLLSHGANPASEDKHGRNVLSAARQERIRALLQEAANGTDSSTDTTA